MNLYIWPAKDFTSRSLVKEGFAVDEWSEGGLRFVAVSDIPPQELEEFQRAFRMRR